jgi:hypothetical protein
MDRGPIAPVDARLHRLQVSRRLDAIGGHPGPPTGSWSAQRRRPTTRSVGAASGDRSETSAMRSRTRRAKTARMDARWLLVRRLLLDASADCRRPLARRATERAGAGTSQPRPRCCAWRIGSATGAPCGSRLVNWWSAGPMRLLAVIGVIAGCRPAGKRRGSRRRCLLGHLSDSGQRLVRPERSSHRQAPQRMLLALRTTRGRKSQGRC